MNCQEVSYMLHMCMPGNHNGMRENYTHQGCTRPPGADGVFSIFPVSSATPTFFAVVCLMTTGYTRLAVVAAAMTSVMLCRATVSVTA